MFPSASEERLAILRGRLRSWKRSGLIGDAEEGVIRERTKTRWTGSSLIARIILFVLTLVCIAAAYGLFDLAGLPAKIASAVVCIAAAELLILRFGLFRAGPDEALYPAAFLLLISALPGPASDEAILLAGGALLIAGARLRNGLHIAGSIAAVAIYIAVGPGEREIAAFLALAAAFAAVALLNREWDHPVWPRILAWSVVLLPLVAWLLMTIDVTASRSWVMGATAIVAMLMIFAGLSIRRHPPIIAGLVLLALTLVEWWTGLAFPVYLRLIGVGAAIGAIVLITHRLLGARQSGITAKPLISADGLQLAEPALAAVVAAAQIRPPGEPRAEGGGGRYGGGGASGEF